MLSLNLTGVVQVICYTLYSGSNKQRQIEMERIMEDLQTAYFLYRPRRINDLAVPHLLDQERFAEICEDNPFLKQLGKLFRYYGYQARTAIDQLRTDMFTGYLAFRTVFILQSNGHILYALTEPILALLSEPQEGGCHEEDDPLE